MKTCFVIMPFRPELRFMYDVISKHIADTFPDVACERGDDKALTVPVLEKISADIRDADVLIADCTGRNPNVFYELGMAHALKRRHFLPLMLPPPVDVDLVVKITDWCKQKYR